MAKANKGVIWLAVGAVVLYLYFSGTMANAAPTGSGNMVSDAQLQQTESFESFSPVAYPDGSDSTGQRYSIGYGHQIQPNESNLLTATITQAQAQQLLLSDMQTVINTLNNSGQTFTQGQFDALSDFGYNAGVGALNSVLQQFSSNGPDAATAKMQQYVYWHPVPGGPAVVNQDLVARRNSEVNTFNS
jgi:lysozyme